MARRTGTEGADRLFGTSGDDLIRGMGNLYPYYSPFSLPSDFIQGNSGNDIISGVGDVSGDAGDDRYFRVNGPLGNLGGTVFKGGTGNDLAVSHLHAAYGSGVWGVTSDLGEGNDRLVLGENSLAFTNSTGSGADEVWVLGRNAAVSVSEGLYQADDERDVVHISGGFKSNGVTSGPDVSSINIQSFDEEDQIVIYDSGLTYRSLALRSTLTAYTLTITLPNDTLLIISMQFDFAEILGPDNITLVDRPLTFEEEVLHGNGDRLVRTFFGSLDSETVRTLGRALLLNDGDDVGQGDRKANLIDGEAGNDLLTGADGADTLRGGTGDDKLFGGDGNDQLFGGSGANELTGGRGDDVLVVGGTGDDLVFGGDGRDRFEFASGGDGEKSITGGKGSDTFVFTETGKFSFDLIRIRGFQPGVDKVDLSGVTNLNYGVDAWINARFDGEGLRIYNILLEGLEPGDLARSDFIL